MLAHVGAIYVENVVKSWMLQKHCKIQCFLMICCVSETPCWSKNPRFWSYVGAKMGYVGAKLGYVVILAHLGAILEPS